ncbi:hypothetical protein V495_03340 [Pseudogymnoascus sp. VKM F-4514 (FW-929)]|nr:hypothetical protein V495_03340 [Pseudogymnoascus sp. VKM F-4514 (FW-929)]KFY60827.1 hypothetical protein V497_03310 [Pseudogymnoascus sp. VKM F-4516 (FW-969)]
MDTETIFHSRKRTLSAAFGPSDGNKNGTISAYDVESEPLPPEPFYSPTIQNALKKGLNIAMQTADALENARLSLVDGDNLPDLIHDAKALCKFEASDTRTVAILGDSGEGKSSLINSLLHYPDLAKTGDMGAACTSVVTEYKSKTSNHKAPITIEAEYLSIGDIEYHIKELLWSYRRKYLPDAEDEDISESEQAKMDRESEEALSSLEAAFGHHEGFSKGWLMKDMSEEGFATVIGQMIEWAQGIDWPTGADSGMWTSTANTADECCEKTSVFMQDQFWPFTKIIRVYVEAEILKADQLTIGAGLQDTNLARVKATQDYLLRCDHIFVVTKISRAITNQSLKSSLVSVVSKHAEMEWDDLSGAGGMKIAIICTNSEEINEKAARREFCGPKKRIPEEVMAKLDRDIEQAKAQGNRSRMKKLKLRQRWLLIGARSAHVQEELQRVYEPETRDGVLQVFCVSNTSYEKYARKGDTEMVLASGIPEVRRFCYSITAHAQELQAIIFLSSKLSSLLNSAALRVNKKTAQPDAKLDHTLRSIVDSVENEALNAVSRYESGFMDAFRKRILTFIDKRSGDWERGAKKQISSWCQWHWSQFSAWCRNDGNHRTKRREKLNWNCELISEMRSEIVPQWDALQHEEIPKLLADLLLSIKAPLLKFQSEIRSKPFGPLLEGIIEPRIRNIEYTYNLAVEIFAKEMKVIRSKASVPNQSSYVTTEMVPSYRLAAQEHGRGLERRQHSIIQGRIIDGSLFSYISTAMKEDVEAQAKVAFNEFRKAFQPTFVLIKKDIKIAQAKEFKFLDKVCKERKIEENRRKTAEEIVLGLRSQLRRRVLVEIEHNRG